MNFDEVTNTFEIDVEEIKDIQSVVLYKINKVYTANSFVDFNGVAPEL